MNVGSKERAENHHACSEQIDKRDSLNWRAQPTIVRKHHSAEHLSIQEIEEHRPGTDLREQPNDCEDKARPQHTGSKENWIDGLQAIERTLVPFGQPNQQGGKSTNAPEQSISNARITKDSSHDAVHREMDVQADSQQYNEKIKQSDPGHCFTFHVPSRRGTVRGGKQCLDPKFAIELYS